MELGYGTAPTTSHALSTSRLLSGSGRHRQYPPRAGVWGRELHARLQDVLREGQRAQGQVPEGGGAWHRQRVVVTLAKPFCLIVDEVGGCVFDRARTDLFFDVIDRRYEKEGPNTMILTSNVAPAPGTSSSRGTSPCSARSAGRSTSHRSS